MNITENLTNPIQITNSTSTQDVLGPLEWSILVISSFIFMMGIIGNYLVIHVVVKNSHMRTITNMFIVNLAVGDFLVLVICLPPSTFQNVTYIWPFEEIMCKIIIYFQVSTFLFIMIRRYASQC